MLTELTVFNERSWKRRTNFAKFSRHKNFAYFFFQWSWNTEVILNNLFSPTFVPNLVTLAYKMSPGMAKEADPLNGPLCAYLMRQNLHNRTRPRLWGNKCPCHIFKMIREKLRTWERTRLFSMCKVGNATKNRHFYFWGWGVGVGCAVGGGDSDKIVLINMFSPTFVSNLVTLAWKWVQEGQKKLAY